MSNNIGSFRKRILTSGLSHVVEDGAVKEVPTFSYLVSGQSDLASIEDATAGSIAYTAGFGSMWQLGLDGNWVEIGGE